jgi:hypothetical protein
MTDETRAEHPGPATQSDPFSGLAEKLAGLTRWPEENRVAGDPLDPLAKLLPVRILTPLPALASRAELAAWFRRQADLIESDGCTELTASWCPIHGDCACPDREDRMDDPACSLHSATSSHGEASR